LHGDSFNAFLGDILLHGFRAICAGLAQGVAAWLAPEIDGFKQMACA
jgi:hypothetical protein